MGNILDQKTIIGTIGELLAQLRLLEYGVQAAPPIKDSGNDLIAIKGWQAKYVQVKTTTTDRFRLNKLPDIYHFVLLIKLKFSNKNRILLDRSEFFLLKREQIIKGTYLISELSDCKFNQNIINNNF